MVDVITVLMMVILLVLMFFMLNFMVNREEEKEDNLHGYNDGGFDYDPYDGFGLPTVTPTPTPTPTPYVDHDDGGGGGGGEPTTTSTLPTETGDEGSELDGEGIEKAAILAVLIDEESGKTIEYAGAVFELFNAANVRQTLSTHYPELITYTDFETTEDGNFFLPEKIKGGTYYFRQMTEVLDYDYAPDAYFEVTEPYEWTEPLVVEIPLGASKNNIQVQINDARNGVGLNGVTFDVVSDGDNITPDGTVRYHNGDVVDTIKCDTSGYGVSIDLYLGNYVLVPRTMPFGYAAPELSTRMVELTRRTAPGAYAPLTVLDSEKTTVRVTVKDELENNLLIPDMAYKLTCLDDASEEREFITNSAGYFEVTDLQKNATYVLSETTVAHGYIPSEDEVTFTVDAYGLIDNNAVHTVEVNNRMIRAEIATIDRVLRMQLSGYNMSLIDQSGKEIYSWVSDGTSFRINGIDTGIYTLKIQGSDDSMTIVIDDVKDIQKFSSTVMTTRSYVFLGCIGAIIVALIVIAVTIVIPKALKKRQERRKKEL